MTEDRKTGSGILNEEISKQHALFSHDEPGPRFRPSTVSDELMRTGVEKSVAVSRVSYYAAKRLIHVRDLTSLYRFALVDMAAAKILSSLNMVGFSDADLLQTVSLNLYASRSEAQLKFFQGKRSPLQAAMDGTFRDEFWWLEIRFYADADTNERDISTAIYEDARRAIFSHPGLGADPAKMLLGNYLVPLSALLLPLKRHLAPKGN